MPEYIAVRCFQCETFQSIQKNKRGKFKCKICNAKQSFRKIYGISFQAKDIRAMVMEYNARRGEEPEEQEEYYTEEPEQPEEKQQLEVPKSKVSKWDVYLTNDDDIDASLLLEAPAHTGIVDVDDYGNEYALSADRKRKKRKQAAAGTKTTANAKRKQTTPAATSHPENNPIADHTQTQQRKPPSPQTTTSSSFSSKWAKYSNIGGEDDVYI